MYRLPLFVIRVRQLVSNRARELRICCASIGCLRCGSMELWSCGDSIEFISCDSIEFIRCDSIKCLGCAMHGSIEFGSCGGSTEFVIFDWIELESCGSFQFLSCAPVEFVGSGSIRIVTHGLIIVLSCDGMKVVPMKSPSCKLSFDTILVSLRWLSTKFLQLLKFAREHKRSQKDTQFDPKKDGKW